MTWAGGKTKKGGAAIRRATVYFAIRSAARTFLAIELVYEGDLGSSQDNIYCKTSARARPAMQTAIRGQRRCTFDATDDRPWFPVKPSVATRQVAQLQPLRVKSMRCLRGREQRQIPLAGRFVPGVNSSARGALPNLTPGLGRLQSQQGVRLNSVASVGGECVAV